MELALRSVWPFRVPIPGSVPVRGQEQTMAVLPQALDGTVVRAVVLFAVGVGVLVTLERLGRRGTKQSCSA